jgi:hypothetical protein
MHPYVVGVSKSKENNMRKAILACAISLFLAYPSYAQTNGGFSICPPSMAEETCKAAVEALRMKSTHSIRPDFLVPDSPAFSVLGVTPENVIRPESTRDFVIAVLNGVDPKGNLQSGVAIDTAPYVLTGVDLADYRNDYLERFLSRVQVSIATTKGSSDEDESFRASIGFRFTLLDKGDARLDTSLDAAFYSLVQVSRLQETVKLVELEDTLEKLANQLAEARAADDKTREKELKDAIEALDHEREELENLTEKDLQEQWVSVLKEHEKGQWNSTSATVGIAPVFLSEDGSLDDIASEGFTVYGTLSYGFEHFGKLPAQKGAGRWLSRNAHLLLHARYAVGEREALEDGLGFREQDTVTLGAQLRFQGPKIWSAQKGGDLAFALEADYIYKDFNSGGGDNLFRFTGVVEVKPFKDNGLTLKVAVGGESGDEEEEDTFIVTSINWALD